MPTKHKAKPRGRPRKKPVHRHHCGGNLFTVLKNAPALAKALAQALAIKTAKKSAIPLAAGATGYYHGRKAPRAIGYV